MAAISSKEFLESLPNKPPVNPGKPFVSILTPTYNRRRFIPSLIRCFKLQTYDKDFMEWIILDDGTDKVGDIFEKAKREGLPIRYYALDEKLNIGAKRNRLNQLARGDIIICMDDDDYYCEDRVKHAVTSLRANPKVLISGSSEIYMYYTDIQKIYKLGPYNPNHATNGTMAYKKEYLKDHTYDELVTHAEETSFLNSYKEPMIQLNSMKVMLVMSHSENTFDKKSMREKPNPLMVETKLKIKDFIKDKILRDFFTTA